MRQKSTFQKFPKNLLVLFHTEYEKLNYNGDSEK